MQKCINTLDDEYMTLSDVCSVLSLSRYTLLEIRKNPSANFPKPITIGKSIRFSKNDIKDWLDKQHPDYGKASIDSQLDQCLSGLGDEL